MVLVSQSFPTLCNPMDCSPQGSYVHGILQATILEWVAILFSRGFSQPRDRTHVSCIADIWAIKKYSVIVFKVCPQTLCCTFLLRKGA